jgi:tetratricopeptide (TPR) repeat protein
MNSHPEASIDAENLITTITPALTDGKLSDALETVKRNWTPEQLIALLTSAKVDVRKVAALSLGFIGDKRAIPSLAIALHDKDAMVNELAEHALWCIWFRSGDPQSVALVRSGSNDLSECNFAGAIEKLTRAIQADPDFAEAYNQRAIAYYLAEDFDKSIRDCQAALQRMPQHFGAMAGMGHCHAHSRRYDEARHCYRLALAINPRLDGVEASLKQIDQIMFDI